MLDTQYLKKVLPNITDLKLLEAIVQQGIVKEFSPGAVLMEPGQFIKSVPIVLEGTIKILRTDMEGKEIFLYYLDRGDTCAVSLTCCSAHMPSEILAVAEEKTTIIAIPVRQHEEWTSEFKQWKEFVAQTYQHRFHEMLRAIDDVAFKKMDQRLLNYLAIKARQFDTKEILTTHQDIARELGTSREVISRLLKQLENEGTVSLGRNKITLEADYEEVLDR
jgi:CRP/FNR family transcriptional regulator